MATGSNRIKEDEREKEHFKRKKSSTIAIWSSLTREPIQSTKKNYVSKISSSKKKIIIIKRKG